MLFQHSVKTEYATKEFIVIPAGNTLPNFTAPQDSGFTRFRHCDRETFSTETANILKEHAALTEEFDKKYQFVTKEEDLVQERNAQERYQEINLILTLF